MSSSFRPLVCGMDLEQNNFEYLARILTRSGRKNTFTEADVNEYKKAGTNRRVDRDVELVSRRMRRDCVMHSAQEVACAASAYSTMMLWGKPMSRSVPNGATIIDLCDKGELTFFEKSTHWVQHDVMKK